ncbi:MAG TPA: UDP-N-acetylmuramate dehydrogenase [Pyrinomonadaceae bacterium]|jgi:UDP-N-acetylmuramate dehydrogenase
MNEPSKTLKIEQNVPLAPLTTLKIGGAARFFVSAETENQVAEAFRFATENGFELFILGGGSNVLVADAGFDGLVLQIALKGIEVKENLVTAQAGEDWDAFCDFCVRENLAGVECLSGIPGFVGGTPVQNVGAYGQEVSETIVAVRVFDRKSGEILELTNADCKFAYRTSIFNSTDKNRFIVLAVTYDLKPDGEPKIVYKDLREFFGDRRPALKETREAVRAIRAEKAMLVRQGGLDANSAGSFFKNPVVEETRFQEIVEIAKRAGIENMPGFKTNETMFKIPAAWLIEQSGFHKGYTKGRAGLSTRHTLALTNRGSATAQEILALKDEIQAKVKEKFGVELIPEPVFVGF